MADNAVPLGAFAAIIVLVLFAKESIVGVIEIGRNKFNEWIYPRRIYLKLVKIHFFSADAKVAVIPAKDGWVWQEANNPRKNQLIFRNPR